MPALVPFALWGEKRVLFSAEDKALLNAAVVGETICPRGIITRVDAGTRPLLERLGLKLQEEDDE